MYKKYFHKNDEWFFLLSNVLLMYVPTSNCVFTMIMLRNAYGHIIIIIILGQLTKIYYLTSRNILHKWCIHIKRIAKY